jgi:hypothetical protein
MIVPKFLERHSGRAGDSAEGRISIKLKLARPGIQQILNNRFRGYDESLAASFFEGAEVSNSVIL